MCLIFAGRSVSHMEKNNGRIGSGQQQSAATFSSSLNKCWTVKTEEIKVKINISSAVVSGHILPMELFVKAAGPSQYQRTVISMMFPPPQSPYNSGRGWQTKTSLHHHQGKFTDIVLTPTLNHHLFNYTSKTKVTSLTTYSPSGSIICSSPKPSTQHTFIYYKLYWRHLELGTLCCVSPLSRVFCLIVLKRDHQKWFYN